MKEILNQSTEMVSKLDIDKSISIAIGHIKDAKNNKNISALQKQTGFCERWFYKVADASIKPSYERALIITAIVEGAK